MTKGIRFLSVLLALGPLIPGAARFLQAQSQPKTTSQPAKQSAKTAQSKPAPKKTAPQAATSASRAKSTAAAKAGSSSAKASSVAASKAAPKATAKAPAKTASKSTTAKAAARRKTLARPAIQQQPTPERYREIQQALIERGFLQGEPTGRWDAASVEALRRFQEAQQLLPTGKIDALSLIRLGLGPKRQNMIAGASPPPPPETQSEP